LTSTLGKDRDLVAIGQRGTTFSTPFFDCHNPLGLTGDHGGSIESLESQSSQCREALSDAGYHFEDFTTEAAVRDVEAIRLAFYPDKKISFYGASYGTTFALELIRQFPASVDSVILDSIFGTDADRAAYGIESRTELARYFAHASELCNAD